MTALRALFIGLLAALAAGCATAPAGSDGQAAAPGASRAARADEPVSNAQASEDEETDARRRARIRLDLAASYYQQRNYNVALEEVRQSLGADPNYPAAHGMLGLIYMDLGERTRSEESFQRALRLSPNDSDINNNYGWFLCQTGRERQSIEHFLRAARNPLYATPARPWQNAGLCAMRAGDEAAGEAHFQRAFQLDPSNPVAMFNLAELSLKRGELDRAKFYATRLLRGYEPSAETLWLGYRVERRAGDRDAAASYAAQLRRRFPESREAGLLAAGSE